MKQETGDRIAIGFVCLVIGVIAGFHIHQEPSGIGGFVYQEIQWQDQTINIIEDNCKNGIYINDWEVEGMKFLQCHSEECMGDFCKDIIWKSPILTNQQGAKR